VPDKTIIQKHLTRNEIGSIVVTMGTNAAWNAVYTPLDSTGAPIGQPRSFQAVFGSDPEFLSWVTNIVLPALNAHEGT
jgi:hypothetical protein